ncbi:cellulose binding domain-containing protein [Thermococcus sp. JCM 11816]|uniref:cellulose binding domain-containing protein n=1 Tax=Thermococcus sp. (strain JCM 11816 / KS-1) TaxID=1295125 RepID=UPI0034652066
MHSALKSRTGGSTEYDVTLNLGGTYDWVVKVKLKDGSAVSSVWSANKAEEGGYVVFTPASWNKGADGNLRLHRHWQRAR